MDEQFLKEALAESRAREPEPDLANLMPATCRAAARLQKRREARRQNLAFFACAACVAPAVAWAARAWLSGGSPEPVSKGILIGVAVLMALTLLLSPWMAYFLEEEREHEKV